MLRNCLLHGTWKLFRLVGSPFASILVLRQESWCEEEGCWQGRLLLQLCLAPWVIVVHELQAPPVEDDEEEVDVSLLPGADADGCTCAKFISCQEDTRDGRCSKLF